MQSQSQTDQMNDGSGYDQGQGGLYDNPVLNAMREVREGKPDTVPVVVGEWPSLTELNEPAFIGSFSWSTSTTKRKIVLRPFANSIYAPLLTPADLARDYLEVKYPKRARISSRQYWDMKNHRTAPLYATPGHLSFGYYVDLKAAYWSILQVIGWDVDYLPGRFLAVRSDVSDFPFPAYKLARNCLVSVGLPGKSTLWTGEKLVQQKRPNRLINLMLWSCVQDVLNSIAADMVDIGAVYVHTDGYILPEERLEDAFSILDEWGLPGSVRHAGEAKIYGAGLYEMDTHKAKRFHSRVPRITDTIDRSPRKWLKPRFSRLAERVVIKLT